MAKYISNRQQNLKIGIVSYTEDKTVLEVTGNVGIGTTNATSKLWVNGDGYFVGVLTANRIFSSQYGEFVGGSISGTSVVGTSLSISGISTLGVTSTTNLTSQQLNVSGITTLGITSATDLTSQQLNVSGISTLGVTSTTNLTSQQLNVSGITTLGISSATDLTSQQLNVSGISTLGVTSTTDLTSQQLNVSGITTVGFITASSAYVSGIVTATTFVGALTGTASNVTTNANLTGDVKSIGNATSIAAGVIVDADINASAGIVDTKLATISTALKVSNSATTATDANTPSAIVARDASGNFSAGTITANLTGTASNVTTNANLTGHVTSVGNAAVLGSFTSSQLATALTDETGSGAAVFATSPTLVTPALGAATATSIVVGSGVTINASGVVASAGIITASQLSTGASGTGINISTDTISGPETLTIDPAAVGDNTGAVRIKGDLYVDGTQFIVNSTTIELADFNVGIATTVGTNALLDGAGIGIGSTGIRKTLTWSNSSTALKSSEDFDVASGKVYRVSGTSVLSNDTLGSGVVNSSLTSVGTLGQLNVTGVSTLGVTSATNLRSQQLNVSGISTLGVTSATNLTSQQLNVSGISTLGVTSTTDLTSQQLNVSGITTLGVTSTTNLTSQQLNVSGISTFTNGPVFIGSATSTGTASQKLQVTGGAYVSANLGVGVTNPSTNLEVSGNSPTLRIYGNSSSTATLDLSSTVPGMFFDEAIKWSLVGNPSGSNGALTIQSNDNELIRVSNNTGNVGLGTINPTSKLWVNGDGYFSGIVTSSGFYVNGELIGQSGITGTNLVGTALSVSGISTFTNGPVLIGGGTSTGTASQKLQVTGGAYVSSNVGVAVTAPSFTVDVSGDARVQSTGKMRFGGTAGTTNFYIQFNSTTNSLDFVAG